MYNTGMLLPVPVVIDADVLLRDVQYVVRKGYLSALLGGASPRYTLMTGVALFATPRVIEEVVRHLPDVANRTGRTEDAVNAVWTERVLPLVRVVSVRDDAIADDRVEAVRARHAADAPTAALTVLLAPAVLATNNRRHFGPLIGSTTTKTNELALDVFTVGQAGLVAKGATMATSLGTIAVSEGVRKLIRVLGGSRAAFLGVAASGAVAVALMNGRGTRARQALGRMAEDLVPAAVTMLGRSAAAGERITGIAVERLGSPDALATVSRFLAVKQTTLATTAVASHLREKGYAFDDVRIEDATRAWLQREPCFVEVSRGHWALGSYADEPAL